MWGILRQVCQWNFSWASSQIERMNGKWTNTDVRGSAHHSMIHIGNPTRYNSVSKFYFIFIWSSTRFRRHTNHHQEPETSLAASGFAYVECCWMCSWWMSNNPPRMQNQRLLVQFYGPDDGRCVARNMLSFIWIWSKILIHCYILLDFLCEWTNIFFLVIMDAGLRYCRWTQLPWRLFIIKQICQCFQTKLC